MPTDTKMNDSYYKRYIATAYKSQENVEDLGSYPHTSHIQCDALPEYLINECAMTPS